MSTQLKDAFFRNNSTTAPLFRHCIVAQGQVQGVGFRPFVYRLAMERQLTGHVSNTPQGVMIEVQGTAQALQSFAQALHSELPPLAELTYFSVADGELIHEEKAFSILHSQEADTQGHTVLISPDVAMCHDCVQDMQDPANVRHLYPFTNCTNCGPRYTITQSIPYDRATTSMACFPLCPTCQKEYDDPLNRRFHAQPNACPICGPQLWLVEKAQCAMQQPTACGETHSESTYTWAKQHGSTGQDALKALAKALMQGKIAAIKGLGGFHLCCNAHDAAAIASLRLQKNRPHKPLAVMVENLEDACQLAEISAQEAQLLVSREKPIVLCKRNALLPQLLAPDTDTLGLVLPYTPLHAALFMHLRKLTQNHNVPLALVMTSGNAGGEPLCLGNREALKRLAPMVDIFLLHNRDILVRNDDSVCAVHELTPQSTLPVFIRRARGFVPKPVTLHGLRGQNLPVVMGMGGELKSTLCLNRHHDAFVSQHMGDLQNLETLAFYREVFSHMEMLLQVKATCLVHDAHPDFLATQVAKELAHERQIPCHALQHHAAHAYAVLAEHSQEFPHHKPSLALTLDGTGFGDDGSIWGGELFHIHGTEYKRLGRLAPFALPGAEQAIKEPWRMALALAQGSAEEDYISQGRPMAKAVLEMLTKNVRSPLCSSAGRLFDAVAAGLGLCESITYEGQAAIRLEQAQKALFAASRQIPLSPLFPSRKQGLLWEVPSQELFLHSMHTGRSKGIPAAAHAFHQSLASSLAHMAHAAALELEAQGTTIRTISLSGGVLHNAALTWYLQHALAQYGFNLLYPKSMPAGDGGLSLGQNYYGLLHCIKS